MGGGKEAEQHERKSKAVVQPSFTGNRKVRFRLLLFPRRTDADIAGKHRIGRRQRAPQHDRGSKRQPHHLGAKDRNRDDRQRHHNSQQTRNRSPRRPAELAIKLEARGEERHNHAELRQPLDDLRVINRVQPVDAEQLDRHSRPKPQYEVDQAGRESTLVLVRQCHQSSHHRDPDKSQPQRVDVAELKARHGGDHPDPAGPGLRRRTIERTSSGPGPLADEETINAATSE